MRQLDLHCNIDENTFSWVIFLTRLLTGLTLLYVGAGCLLYSREFLYNATALGVPLPMWTGILLIVCEVILALLLILGCFTRITAALCAVGTLGLGVIFFAAEINKIYVALILLLLAALLPACLLGPGKISIDYKRAVARAEKIGRG